MQDMWRVVAIFVTVCVAQVHLTSALLLSPRASVHLDADITVVDGQSYVASASESSAAPGHEAFRAFEYFKSADSLVSSSWVPTGSYDAVTFEYSGTIRTIVESRDVFGEWVQIQLPTPITCHGYRMLSAAGSSLAAARGFMFVGSNDGVVWSELNSQDDAAACHLIGSVTCEFMIDSALRGPFSYYRLIATKTVGSSRLEVRGLILIAETDIRVSLARADMMVVTPSPTPTESESLSESTSPTPAPGYVIQPPECPINSHTCTVGDQSFAITASTETATYEAWFAFDRVVGGGVGWVPTGQYDINTYGYAGSVSTTVDVFGTTHEYLGEWIQIRFLDPIWIVGFSIWRGPDVKSAPQNFVFVASNDGLTWRYIDSKIGITNWSDEVKENAFGFDILGQGSYSYFRLIVMYTFGGSGFVQLNEVNLFASVSPSPSPSPSVSESNTPSHSESNTPSHTESNTPSISESNTPFFSESSTLTPSISESNTPSISESNTPSVSVSNTPTQSESNTPSHSESDTPSHTESNTPSFSESNTPFFSESSTLTPSISESNTPSISESNTPSISVSNTPTQSESNTPSHTESNTPSFSESNTPFFSESSTLTPSISESNTPSISDSHTPSHSCESNSESNTPSHSESDTPSHTESNTPSFSESNTPFFSESSTLTPSISESNTPSISESNTPSISVSNTPTQSESNTPSHSESDTPSHTESNTPSFSESNTPFFSESSTLTPSISESNTPSISESNTPSISVSNTPTQSESNTPSHTESNTPSFSESNTPFFSESSTLTPSISESNTPSISDSHTPSHSCESNTPSISESNTPSHSESNTPSHTESNTPSHTESNTPSISESNTPSISESNAPSHGESNTPSHSESNTPSISESKTASHSVTGTPSPSDSSSSSALLMLSPVLSYGPFSNTPTPSQSSAPVACPDDSWTLYIDTTGEEGHDSCVKLVPVEYALSTSSDLGNIDAQCPGGSHLLSVRSNIVSSPLLTFATTTLIQTDVTSVGALIGCHQVDGTLPWNGWQWTDGTVADNLNVNTTDTGVWCRWGDPDDYARSLLSPEGHNQDICVIMQLTNCVDDNVLDPAQFPVALCEFDLGVSRAPYSETPASTITKTSSITATQQPSPSPSLCIDESWAHYRDDSGTEGHDSCLKSFTAPFADVAVALAGLDPFECPTGSHLATFRGNGTNAGMFAFVQASSNNLLPADGCYVGCRQQLDSSSPSSGWSWVDDTTSVNLNTDVWLARVWAIDQPDDGDVEGGVLEANRENYCKLVPLYGGEVIGLFDVALPWSQPASWLCEQDINTGSHPHKSSGSTTPLIIGVCVGGGLVLTVLLVILLRARWQRTQKRLRLTSRTPSQTLSESEQPPQNHTFTSLDVIPVGQPLAPLDIDKTHNPLDSNSQTVSETVQQPSGTAPRIPLHLMQYKRRLGPTFTKATGASDHVSQESGSDAVPFGVPTSDSMTVSESSRTPATKESRPKSLHAPLQVRRTGSAAKGKYAPGSIPPNTSVRDGSSDVTVGAVVNASVRSAPQCEDDAVIDIRL